MITETYGGICPVCKFDRMMMRYGTQGWWKYDACPRCGFAYGSDDHKGYTPMEVWQSIINGFSHLFDRLELPKTIGGCFAWVMSLPQPAEVTDEPKQVFQYTDKEIEDYKKSKLYKRRSVNIPVKVVFT